MRNGKSSYSALLNEISSMSIGSSDTHPHTKCPHALLRAPTKHVQRTHAFAIAEAAHPKNTQVIIFDFFSCCSFSLASHLQFNMAW